MRAASGAPASPFTLTKDLEMKRLAPIAGATLLAVAPAAEALEFGPLIAEITVEIENDTVVDSTDPAAEISDTYATIEAAMALAIGASSSLNASLVFEPITGATRDRAFEELKG